MSSNTDSTRRLWIELIGFDNEKSDFGVPEFLDRIGFVPDGIALLLFNPDFIHSHDRGWVDRVFPPDICCYGGYPASEERNRQVWTGRHLAALVGELHSAGIPVFPSVFDLFAVPGPWLAGHPEVLHISRTRGRIPSLCPWKRLADGSFYEDFFVRKLCAVIREYGFDGFFGADGYNPPRIPIYDGDFSDDMVGQFTSFTGTDLPPFVSAPCEEDIGRIQTRGEWIWRNRRREWIEFYTDRTARFWRKVCAALHAEDKRVYVNSTWTRGPFESMYRFGVDYRRLATAGVDGFVLEAAAAALETIAEPESSSRVLHNFTAAILLTKASAPNTPMLWLHGVKDTNEDWHAVRQAPMALESEILTFSHLYHRRTDGETERCVQGPMVCLADCIKDHEWQWLRERWDMGLAAVPPSVLGATLVEFAPVLDRELHEYTAARRWTVHRTLHHLLASGACIQATAAAADIDAVDGTLVVLGAHLWTSEDLVAARLVGRNGPTFLIGYLTGKDIPAPDRRFAETDRADGMVCAVYNVPDGWVPAPSTGDPDVAELLEDAEMTYLPKLFYEELPYRDVSRHFLKQCAHAINRLSVQRHVRLVEEPPGVALWAMQEADGTLRLLIRNDRFISQRAWVEAVSRRIQAVAHVNSTTHKPVIPSGNRFGVTVPARGAALVRVFVEDSQTP